MTDDQQTLDDIRERFEIPDHVPDDCIQGDHVYGQAGRCRHCGADRVDDTRTWEDRRTGGAGSLTQPLTNGEYRREMEKLTEVSDK